MADEECSFESLTSTSLLPDFVWWALYKRRGCGCLVKYTTEVFAVPGLLLLFSILISSKNTATSRHVLCWMCGERPACGGTLRVSCCFQNK